MAKEQEQLWNAKLLCHDCKALLNEAHNVPTSEKVLVITTSALVAGRCPNGCRSTFSDCNINTDIVWEEVESQAKGITL